MTDRFENERRDALDTSRPARGPVARNSDAKKSATDKPIFAIFMLGRRGHQRLLGDSSAEADSIYERSRKYVELVRKDVRKRAPGTRVRVFEFSSFDQLVGHHLPARGPRWTAAMLITHGTMRVANSESGIFQQSGIWLGDREYFARHPDNAAVIYEAMMNVPGIVLQQFQGSFDRDAELQIICCGLGQTPGEVAEFMRDVFGTDGAVAIPKVAVDLDPSTGRLGAIVDGDPDHIRPLTSADWALVPARR